MQKYKLIINEIDYINPFDLINSDETTKKKENIYQEYINKECRNVKSSVAIIGYIENLQIQFNNFEIQTYEIKTCNRFNKDILKRMIKELHEEYEIKQIITEWITFEKSIGFAELQRGRHEWIIKLEKKNYISKYI